MQFTQIWIFNLKHKSKASHKLKKKKKRQIKTTDQTARKDSTFEQSNNPSRWDLEAHLSKIPIYS